MLDRFAEYISVSENRDRLLKRLQTFVIVGGVVMTTFMILAIINKW